MMLRVTVIYFYKHTAYKNIWFISFGLCIWFGRLQCNPSGNIARNEVGDKVSTGIGRNKHDLLHDFAHEVRVGALIQ